MATKCGDPGQTCPLNKNKELPPPHETEHWIRFNIENEFSEPVPKVSVKIILSDNTVKETKSGDDGLVEIKNVKPGGTFTLQLTWDDVEKNRSKS